MKDLIERVQDALKYEPSPIDWEFEHRARAAIRAVLIHFSEPYNVKHLGVNPQVVASAMRAALEELK